MAGREPPTGTVTFLFTDIEGSTRLAQALGPGWPPVLERHREIARDAWAAHRGVEVLTEGDSFFVVFAQAPDAVAAAVDAQRGFAAESWPDGAGVRVRMGLHTGEGRLSGGSYVGLDVHRAARIASAGHGGQVLLSSATQGLVESSLPPGVALRDLGEHTLKDLLRRERISDLVIEGLPDEFPALATLDAVQNNLPAQLTSFLGREREIEEATRLLAEARLLTLTGPGGTGKTRLALQTAAAATDRFPDGIYFVPLGMVAAADLVAPTIAQTMGVPIISGSVVDRLVDHLTGKCVLLVLDNFEQVEAAAPDIADLLVRCPQLWVLVTSRSPLRVYGEHEYPVPPLRLPDPAALPPLEELATIEAVALFVDRAHSVRPDFTLSTANAAAVAAICNELDGLPLAIELAAARVRVFTPPAIATRLRERLDSGRGSGDRLALLGASARDRPERQQTLRGAIAWSYDLLDEQERRAFTRFSVFAGGAGLPALEDVVGYDGPDEVLDAVTSLLDKSLVRQSVRGGDEPRFAMLTTIRAFALEQLEGRGEADDLHRRHARWVREYVQAQAAVVLGPNRAQALDAFALEHDNIRATLTWALGAGEVELAREVFASTWRFWQTRGYLAEAREWADEVMAMTGDGSPADQVSLGHAAEAAGGIAYWQGDLDATEAWYRRALEVARASGDDAAVAHALFNLSFAFTRVGTDETAMIAVVSEALELFRKLGDDTGVAHSLWGLGTAYFYAQDYDTGEPIAREALEYFRKSGDAFMTAWAHHMVGVFQLRNDHAGMRESLRAALDLFRASDDKSGHALVFDAFASLAWAEGQPTCAMRLYGFAKATERASGTGLASLARASVGFAPDALLEDPALAAAFAEGQRMTLDQATSLALEPDWPSLEQGA